MGERHLENADSGAWVGPDGDSSPHSAQSQGTNNIPPTTVVQLTVEELDGRIARGAEALANREREEREAQANRIQELETLVKSLLEKENSRAPNPQFLEEEAPPVCEEMIQLVDDQPPEQPIREVEEDCTTSPSTETRSFRTRRSRASSSIPRRSRASSSIPMEGRGDMLTKDTEEWHVPFGESTYTLLYLEKARSQGFWYGVFVYALQVSTILLTQVNIMDTDSEENPLQLPHMVAPTVTWAQGVALFMALAFQSDLIEAVLKLQDGFHPEILETHPGATYYTWLFACVAQLLAGLLLLATIFILTMQAKDVLSIMLNFAALHFMAEIDDCGFAIARLGFVTNKLQRETQNVVNVRVPKRKSRNRQRRILYVLALIGLFIGYGILKGRQLNGYYLPTYIHVQFGDAYNPRIPFYSGILSSGNSRTQDHREYHDLTTGNILLLGYCKAKKSWAFSFGNDPCDFFAKSKETTSYDVTTMPNSDWEVLDSTGRLQPFDSFSLGSRDCNSETCQGQCGADGLCQCPHDKFGMVCEFSNVSLELLVDKRFRPFPEVTIKTGPSEGDLDTFAISNVFQLLKNPDNGNYVRVYNMPAYYSTKSYPANILFFGGRRWIITSEWDLFNLTEAQLQNPDTWFFPIKTIATLENNFHGYHQANYTPFFISDPVDFETPDFQPTPVGLGWWTVKEDKGAARHYELDAPLETVLKSGASLEASCRGQPENFCGLNGHCQESTGACVCENGYTGSQCKSQSQCYDWPCGGNGACDESSGICRCNLPYYGKLCKETHKCYEVNGRCKNGGICNMTTGDCDCPADPAISGVACEKRASCFALGCANGGICGFNGNCICRSPFYGTHCDLVNATKEQFICAKDDDCMNGRCDINTGTCLCDDLHSYGTLCEHSYNCSLASSVTEIVPSCLNSGICNETSDLCDCPDPYFGPDCSQVPPCLKDEDCGGDAGWGSCDISTGMCSCLFGPAAGKRCEKPGFCEENDDCYHFGICNTFSLCECNDHIGGYLCESLIVGKYDPTLDEKQEWFEENIQRCGFEDPFCVRCQTEDPPPSYCEDGEF